MNTEQMNSLRTGQNGIGHYFLQILYILESMLKIYLYVLAEMLLMSLMRKEQTNTQFEG